MNINSALKKLYSLHQFGIKLGLDNTRQLLDLMHNPQNELKCFHIAGSNGKGSTASFIASILMELGFKVGLYTSPHFIRFNERIRINGEEIVDEYITDFVSSLESYIDKHEPTFFELTTALAFKYFADQKVDYAVIETGLGGRLDSTNVINPLASIITTISFEHTNILGDTIEKIAYEKGGIIKKEIPVFIGNLVNDAEGIIKNKSIELGCKFFSAKDFASITNDHVVVKTRTGDYKIYKTALPGAHQLVNAALAVKVVSEIIPVSNPLLLSRGLKNVIRNSKIQGRYEVFSARPKIIFDSAHNPEGIESFIKEFRGEASSYRSRYLIFSVMKDKNYSKMLEMVSSLFTTIYFTQIEYERAADYKGLSQVANKLGITLELLENPVDFIRQFQKGGKDDCLVILGSMYLLGEIKSKILEKGLDIEAATA